jgi:hypothetical protein
MTMGAHHTSSPQAAVSKMKPGMLSKNCLKTYIDTGRLWFISLIKKHWLQYALCLLLYVDSMLMLKVIKYIFFQFITSFQGLQDEHGSEAVIVLNKAICWQVLCSCPWYHHRLFILAVTAWVSTLCSSIF